MATTPVFLLVMCHAEPRPMTQLRARARSTQ
jgi:hypothetical protein